MLHYRNSARQLLSEFIHKEDFKFWIHVRRQRAIYPFCKLQEGFFKCQKYAPYFNVSFRKPEGNLIHYPTVVYIMMVYEFS